MSSVKKVAIITGASQDNGAGVAEAYSKRGYAVVAAALSMPASDDPDVLAVAARSPRCTRSGEWPRQATLWRRSCTWSRPRSSPARSCAT